MKGELRDAIQSALLRKPRQPCGCQWFFWLFALAVGAVIVAMVVRL